MDIGQFFAKDYTGGSFELFGPGHLTALLVIFLFNLWLLRFRNAPESTRHTVRWTLAIVLWVNELGWHIWKYSVGEWTIQEMLPLHVCSLLIWVGGIALVTKNYRVYEFMYFMGIGGAVQALLTPEAGIYGFPHYRIFQTIISHGTLVSAGVYMTTVEGFRPTWKTLGRVFVWMNVYMLVVFFFNGLIGSNYLFLAHKPETASLFDVMPPWPYYIAVTELIGLAMCLFLYLPFIVKDGKHQRI